MRTRILLSITACAVLLSVQNPADPALQAQKPEDSLVINPDLTLPPNRIDPNVQYSVREARNRELEAIALERKGKKDEALEKWRDAMARYESLRKDKLSPDMPLNSELLVRAEWQGGEHVYAETWIPLADYINSRYRIRDWPRPLRDQLSMRQAAPGAELLRTALAAGDEAILARCARFYQFSQSGRTALRMLAETALERGDAVLAVRWLHELQESWPEYYEREPALQVLYVRACRDAGMNYRLGKELRRRERDSASGTVDVGGVKVESSVAVKELTSSPAPQERPELRPNGWLTLHGNGARNGVAPPVVGIGEMIDLDAIDGVQGSQIAKNIPGVDEQRDQYNYEERKPVPVPFPTVHESGFFVHKIDELQGGDEKLLWFRHGREANPVTLEVPKGVRYTVKTAENRRYYYGGREQERLKYRVMGSTIGRLHWDLDQRESDVLFAVMGPGSASREKGAEPSGNQIQSWDLTDDAKLRVTLPNKKVESEEDYKFLQHVVFKGAPLIRGNRLYIAGAVTEKDSVEAWMFCFDVTPKGDAAAGEGKLQWRVHLCSRRQESQPWSWGPEPVTVPEISAPAEQGGMLYVSTHSGATAAVDRMTGEVCWVSRYGRVKSQIFNGWFPNPPIAAEGMVVTTPYDFDLALILDAVAGTHMMEYPMFRKGLSDEYEHVLGVVDNRMIIQGRTRVYSVGLTDFRKGGERAADFGQLNYQTADYGKQPIGRGVIAGNRVLIPFEGEIAFYDVSNGKLITQSRLAGITSDKVPLAITVYCRGEAYKDEQGIARYKPVSVTDPDTGNVYNVEHLRNGDTYKFPSGKVATVKKETFVILASARWVYAFKAQDGGK
ncbi:MAG: PQQ-like beta-propeller repeat protein [Planctomycetes bacterium]|nr:PQQ-like beta-propeller repeat protein [Planctomycetota bacterium]